MRKTLVYLSSPKLPFQKRVLVWDVSEKYLRDMAYVDLFKILDEELDAYSEQDSVVCSLINLARNGNPEAAEALLCYRRNREGEQFEEIETRPGVYMPALTEAKLRKVTSVTTVRDWDEETGMEITSGPVTVTLHKDQAK